MQPVPSTVEVTLHYLLSTSRLHTWELKTWRVGVILERIVSIL